MNTNVQAIIKEITTKFGGVTSSAKLYEIGRKHGLTYKGVKETFLTDMCKVGRGEYDVRMIHNSVGHQPEITLAQPIIPQPERITVAAKQKVLEHVEEAYIPDIDPTYVPWGEFKSVLQAINSKMFFPIFISGPSGNGKSMMVEQACAKARREYVRVQITPESDETDLIGGFRLVNGETVFYKGPVIVAFERGAVLLIDELDRGGNKLLCLQGVLEGKPILIKKIGQVITPAPGFTVIATANTKGRGSEDGRYCAANIIDDAFLERFVASIDQSYPDIKIEGDIVLRHMNMYQAKDEDFANKLVAWAQIIRKTYEADGVDEVISTRRLCHIAKTFSIFKDRRRSIELCINRFDEDTRSAFNDLYSKIDSSLESEVPIPEGIEVTYKPFNTHVA